MTELVSKADSLIENAKDEFDRLSGMSKIKASAKTVSLVRDVKQVPKLMEQAKDELQKEVDQIKQVSQDLKDEAYLAKMQTDSKKCAADKKLAKPVECYLHIYGPYKSKALSEQPKLEAKQPK